MSRALAVADSLAQAAIFTLMVILAMQGMVFIGYVVLVMHGVVPWVALAGVASAIFALSAAVHISSNLQHRDGANDPPTESTDTAPPPGHQGVELKPAPRPDREHLTTAGLRGTLELAPAADAPADAVGAA